MQKKLYVLYFVFSLFTGVSQVDSLRGKKRPSIDSSLKFYNMPLFSMTGNDAETGAEAQEISSLLQAGNDLFTQYAGFQFGMARYRSRGYNAENFDVMINGILMTDPETGYSTWSSWGGLNDVTRFVETRPGNAACRYGFSSVGGYAAIDSKASSFRKGTRVSYANANTAFRNRFMITHATGLMKNTWALTFSASVRKGDEVYIPGTYFDARAFYLSLDKKFNHRHLLSFTGFYAPVEKGLAAAATHETFSLTGDPYYNSLWGYQAHKVRNASVSRNSQPTLLVTHVYTPARNKRISSGLYHISGRSGLSGLNYYNAPNPRPDYYKYLPGYFYAQGNTGAGDAATQNWQNDVQTRQINWDRLIAMNQANLYTLPSQNGTQSVNTTETRARYILENRVERKSHTGFNLVYHEQREQVSLSAGIRAFSFTSRKYKEMEDLLGASFWIDIDPFVQDAGTDPVVQQNDINRPDRKIYKGDRFGYDYMITILRAEGWAQAEYSFKNTDIYSALSISDTKSWRTGYVANGKFPLNSKGDSEPLSFLNYGFRGGATCKLNGRNFISGNISALSRPPETSGIFLSPQVRNDLVDDIRSEELLSADLSYQAKYRDLRIKLSVYTTQINKQTWLRTYYDDAYNTLVNLVMTGVDETHRGFELGFEKMIRAAHSFQLVSGFSQSYYSSQPKLQAYQNNNNAPLYYNRRVYLKNYRTGNSPQFVSALGYRFSGRKQWTCGIYLNYFDKIYVVLSPERRTAEAVEKFRKDEKELAEQITCQEKLPAYSILNASISKSFLIRRKYSLGINLSATNLLNNKNHIAQGYEQLRRDPQDISRFPNKYSYMPGTGYMLILNFSI